MGAVLWGAALACGRKPAFGNVMRALLALAMLGAAGGVAGGKAPQNADNGTCLAHMHLWGKRRQLARRKAVVALARKGFRLLSPPAPPPRTPAPAPRSHERDGRFELARQARP